VDWLIDSLCGKAKKKGSSGHIATGSIGYENEQNVRKVSMLIGTNFSLVFFLSI
jgi:hypothetical protein